MGELGEETKVLHQSVGHYANEVGVKKLFACGPLSEQSVASFGADGQHFKTKEALIEVLMEVVSERTVVLVKGSRSAGMEQVVDAICEAC